MSACPMYKYRITIYWSEADQAFVTEVPALPGCRAHGDSSDAALANCTDAIALWIDTAAEIGRPVPMPLD